MKKVLIVCCVCFFAFGIASSFAENSASGNESAFGKFPAKEVLKALTEPMEKVISPVLELNTVVVTASKLSEKLGAQSSDVSVLTRLDFDKGKYDTVKSVLLGEIGLDVIQTGSFSGQTAVFMRGANSNHTKIMVDGIEMYDPISPNAAFDLANVTLDNVDRIEIVRGPQSALYGSDAIGGVINIMTRRAKETFFDSYFETGAFSSFKESFNMGDSSHGFSYSLAGSHTQSRGISQAQAKNDNPELDGYVRRSLSTRVDYNILDGLTVGGTFRGTAVRSDYDDFGKDDPNVHKKEYSVLFSQYIDHQVFDFYSYNVKLGWMFSERRTLDANEGTQPDYLRGWNNGYMFTVDYRNNFYLWDTDTFTIGYQFTREMGYSYRYNEYTWAGVAYVSESSMPKVFARNSALYLQNRFNLSDRLTATQGMRIDYHSQSGTHITYKLDGSYLLPSGTKLRAVWATGFKSPTLYQLNARAIPFMFGGGNAELKPETSNSYEIGVDQYLYGEQITLRSTYFHTMFNDLIDSTYNPATFFSSQYQNVAKAHSHGVEIGAKIQALENMNFNLGYTYNFTKDYSTDRPLLRRPLHKFAIDVLWEVIPKLKLDIKTYYSGIAYDSGIDKLKQHLVTNITAGYQVHENVNAYVKIDNAFDKRYEEVRGYGMSPLAVYVGVKAEI